MAFSLEAAGAGAGQGLDDYLQRMLLEQQVQQKGAAQQEDVRHNQATEALSGRGLDELAGTRSAAEALTRAKIAENATNDADETRRQAQEDAALADPKTPDAIKQFIQLRRITKKGETVPWEVIPGLQKPSVDPLEHVDVGGKDVLTPRSQAVGKPGFHAPPQPSVQFLPTDDGFVRAPRNGGPVTPVLGADGQQVMPQSPAAVRSRQDLAERVSSHFDDVQSLLDEADKKGLLGPLQGRTFNEFMAGKVGSTGNAQNDELLGELRQNLSLARSGLAQLHGRGGANTGIVQGLEKNMDAGFMSHAELSGALKAMKGWVDTYARKKSSATSAAPADSDPLGLGFKK